MENRNVKNPTRAWYGHAKYKIDLDHAWDEDAYDRFIDPEKVDYYDLFEVRETEGGIPFDYLGQDIQDEIRYQIVNTEEVKRADPYTYGFYDCLDEQDIINGNIEGLDYAVTMDIIVQDKDTEGNRKAGFMDLSDEAKDDALRSIFIDNYANSQIWANVILKEEEVGQDLDDKLDIAGENVAGKGKDKDKDLDK